MQNRQQKGKGPVSRRETDHDKSNLVKATEYMAELMDIPDWRGLGLGPKPDGNLQVRRAAQEAAEKKYRVKFNHIAPGIDVREFSDWLLSIATSTDDPDTINFTDKLKEFCKATGQSLPPKDEQVKIVKRVSTRFSKKAQARIEMAYQVELESKVNTVKARIEQLSGSLLHSFTAGVEDMPTLVQAAEYELCLMLTDLKMPIEERTRLTDMADAMFSNFVVEGKTAPNLDVGKLHFQREIAETWEEYLDAQESGPADVPIDGDEAKKLMSLLTPTEEENLDALKMEDPHGHAVLAQSRRVATTHCRLRAIRSAKTQLRGNRHVKACVFDIGAGAVGVKHASYSRRINANKGLYFHCSIPIVDQTDVTRMESLKETVPGFEFINWVDVTNVVMPDRLNCCRHKAADCTCFKFYDAVYAFAIHSAYYFKEADWRNLMVTNAMTVARVECAVHIPVFGRAVPAESGEFEWKTVEESNLGWLSKLKHRLSDAITGESTVVFQPTKTMGTTYVQTDPSEFFGNGGRHFCTDMGFCEADPFERLKQAARGGAAVAAMQGLVSRFAYPQLPGSLLAAAAVLGGSAYTYGVLRSQKLVGQMLRSADCGAALTGWNPLKRLDMCSCKVVPGHRFTYHGEELVSTYDVMPCLQGNRLVAAVLERRILRSPNTKPGDIKDVVAGLAVTSTPAEVTVLESGNVLGSKGGRNAAATLSRRGRAVDAIKDTVVEAAKAVRFLGECISEPRPPPGGALTGFRRWRSVWGSLLLDGLVTGVLFALPSSGFIAPVLCPWLTIVAWLMLMSTGLHFCRALRMTL
jgi:hypothetical protein